MSSDMKSNTSKMPAGFNEQASFNGSCDFRVLSIAASLVAKVIQDRTSRPKTQASLELVDAYITRPCPDTQAGCIACILQEHHPLAMQRRKASLGYGLWAPTSILAHRSWTFLMPALSPNWPPMPDKRGPKLASGSPPPFSRMAFRLLKQQMTGCKSLINVEN